MTSSRKRSKRRASCSILVIALVSLLPSLAFAQGGIRQYSRQAMLGGRLPAQVLLVGLEKDAKDIERLLDLVTAKAGEVALNLDPNNPAGEVGQLMAKGSMQVSEETAFAFEEALKVAGWTGGRFDIVLTGDGSYRDIKLSSGSRTVELKRPGMQIRFDPIINGVLAELMVRMISAVGMNNAIVKVGTVFRGMGSGMGGPWQIQVQDDAGTFARHALNLTIQNTGVATVSASQFRAQPPIDPRSKQPIAPPVRGVVALMNDAALADGIAYAAFLAGPDEGQKLLARYGKGLIVDADGKFIRTPGF